MEEIKVKTETRTNNKKETEIVISDFSSFEDLVNYIHEIKSDEKKYNKKPKRIIVEKSIWVKNKEFNDPINLSRVTFDKNVYFINTAFNENVYFIHTKFNENAHFNSSKFLGQNTNFTMAEFNAKHDENFETRRYSTIFNGTSFKNNIRFSKARFNGVSHFFNAEFTEIKLLDFGATFENIARFDYSTFKDKNFKDNKPLIKFSGTKFNKEVTFHDCDFYSPISFKNTTFNGLVDFTDANFKEPQSFHTTEFLDKGIFVNTKFEKEAQFLYCKLAPNSYISFQDATFEKGLDISRSNFNFGKTSFWNIKVEDEGLLSEDTLSSDEYKKDFGEEEIQPSVPKKLRESMRFIKHSFYAEANKIEGSEFEKKEMEIYRKELEKSLKEKR